MNVSPPPVGHVGLAPKDDEHVEPTGPGAHRPPVLLHPGLHLRVLKVLQQKLKNIQIFNMVSCGGSC